MIKKILTIIALTIVICTVFVIDSSLSQGVVKAKYFWFAGMMCIISLLIPFILKNNEIFITDILFIIWIVYINISRFFLTVNNNINWQLTLLMIPLYIAVRTTEENKKLQQRLLDVVLVIVLIEAAYGLLQVYGFVRSNHILYSITGTFFNPGPYSGFIAVGIPLALSFSLNKSLPKWEQILGAFTLFLSLPALTAAMSRAAWIAAFVGCVPVLIRFTSFRFRVSNYKRITLLVVGCIFVLILMVGMYHMKKDSADGRWVIWNVSMKAVKENPLFGVGYGRFAAVYGESQAEYFLNQERSDAQIMVADSPDYAFNEYVQMTVELGVVGLILFLLLIASPFVKRKKSFLTIHATLLTFLVFAAFSYPFNVLPLGILFIILLALSAQSSRKCNFYLSFWVRVIIISACFGVTAYSAYNILPKQSAYKSWKILQQLKDTNAYSRTAEEYGNFYDMLRHEKKFLFEYAQCLTKAGKYKESNRLFEEYLLYGSDPMAYNCMGNNFKEMGEYKIAEYMYIYASQIVPNRHYPLYLLMKLYTEIGQTEKAIEMAEKLLKKPIKVYSEAISEMQKEAKKIMIND